MPPALTDIYIGPVADRISFTKATITPQMLATYGNRFTLAFKFDTVGVKKVDLNFAGSHITKGFTVTSGFLGGEYPVWFEWPKERRIPGTYQVGFRVTEMSPSGSPLPDPLVKTFDITLTAPAEEEVKKEKVTPPEADVLQWLFSQWALRPERVAINGQVVVSAGRVMSPATVNYNEAIRIESLWFGNQVPFTYQGVKLPGSNDCYIAAMVDGSLVGFTTWAQGIDYPSISGHDVIIDAGKVLPGTHLLVLVVGFSGLSDYNISVLTSAISLTVKSPKNLKIDVSLPDLLSPGQSSDVSVQVTCNDVGVSGALADMYLAGNKVSSGEVYNGRTTLKCTMPESATPGQEVQGRVAVTGAGECGSGEKTFTLLVGEHELVIDLTPPGDLATGAPFTVSVKVTCDGKAADGAKATLYVNNVMAATDTVIGGSVALKGAIPPDAKPRSKIAGRIEVFPGAGTPCPGGTKSFNIGVKSRAGRSVEVYIPDRVVDGQATEIRAYLTCAGEPSNGEIVTFTVDGRNIGTGTTKNGVATIVWQATTIPSPSHKIGAIVPVSDKCPGGEAAYSTKSITVLTAREAGRAAASYAELAGAPGRAVGEVARFVTTTAIPSGALIFPTITIPEVPAVPLPTAPETPSVPVVSPGKISIPSVGLPEKFADSPISITIDGEPVGPPPVSKQVTPGVHTVRVQVKGLMPLYTKVTVGSGETKALTNLGFM